MADSPVIEGQILAGKYRVERVLGSGGMGVVVAAWHLELEQRVAVKFLHPLALEREDTAERFRREARSAAKIRSEHVARVIDVGIMEGGIPYMVMEYLQGHDVSEEMSKVGMLPIADAIDFILQAVEALAEAHAAGIVHRDLKPANLFIAIRPDGTRIVKVLDFGISKSLFGGSVAELSLTRTSVLIGSPLYMSPEQMRSAKDVDTRTDIWSLGVILYEMITARPPYTGDSIPALCAALLSDVPASMQTLRSDVPLALEDVIMRCLTKDRQQRFGTVSELARALAPFGSASSQLHVDRASRVLGLTDASSFAAVDGHSASDASGNHRASELSGSHGASDTRGSQRVSDARGSQRISDARGSQRISDASAKAPEHALPGLVPERGTVDSWGRTRAANQPRSRGLLFVGLGLAMVVLLSALLLLGMRQPATPPTASTPLAPPLVVPMPVQAPAPHPPEPDVLPSTAALDPAAPVVLPQAPGPAQKPAAIPVPATFKPAPSPPAKPAAPSELSDFGGRR
jgi:eukaryotic-like serine/threonine-protein kinase